MPIDPNELNKRPDWQRLVAQVNWFNDYFNRQAEAIIAKLEGSNDGKA